MLTRRQVATTQVSQMPQLTRHRGEGGESIVAIGDDDPLYDLFDSYAQEVYAVPEGVGNAVEMEEAALQSVLLTTATVPRSGQARQELLSSNINAIDDDLRSSWTDEMMSLLRPSPPSSQTITQTNTCIRRPLPANFWSVRVSPCR